MGMNIYPTLVECFSIILIGYISAKFNFITKTQSKGISIFISQVSLPALIFKAMVEVDFYSIDIHLFSGLLIAKTILFIVVAVLTYFLQKSDALGKAGIFAIFVTQSNDFAFGLPILKAVFNSPDNKYLVDYLYLVAPINLAFLNPIGFALLEYQRAKNNFDNKFKNEEGPMEFSSSHASVNYKGNFGKKILITTIKGIVFNPLIFMIVFGIAGNFVFNQHIPSILGNFFEALSSAFGATALFYLGLSLGSQTTKMKGIALILPVVLVAVKGILMPILMRQLVFALVQNPQNPNNMTTNTNHTLQTEDASTFAFLYGTIPTTPTVMIFASKYGIGEETTASGLIFGTILSGPIIFSSIRMLQVKEMVDVHKFTKLIGDVCKDVSIIGLLCCIWVIAVLILLKTYKRLLYKSTIILITFQFLLGIMGSFFENYSEVSNDGLLKFSLWLLITTLHGCSIWTGIVSLNLYFIISGKEMLLHRWRYGILWVGLGVPLIAATITLLTTPDIVNKAHHSAYFFQSHCLSNYMSMGVMFIIFNIFALTSIVAALIKLNLPNKQVSSNKLAGIDNDGQCNVENDLMNPNCPDYPSCDVQGSCDSGPCDSGLFQETIDIESLDSSSCLIRKTYDAVNSGLREKDVGFLKNVSEMENIELNWLNSSDKNNFTNHVVLLLFLGFSILLNLILTFWHMITTNVTKGLLLEMEMLGTVILYGQGFFSFIIFGFLKELFTLPFFERFRASQFNFLLYKKIKLQELSEVDPDVLLLCERFKKHHLNRCAQDIVSNLKFRFKTYENVFKGNALVNWLIESGLVLDRTEAISYGDKLLQGRLLEHCVQQHHFYDLPYFYQFIPDILDTTLEVSQESRRSKRFTK